MIPSRGTCVIQREEIRWKKERKGGRENNKKKNANLNPFFTNGVQEQPHGLPFLGCEYVASAFSQQLR